MFKLWLTCSHKMFMSRRHCSVCCHPVSNYFYVRAGWHGEHRENFAPCVQKWSLTNGQVAQMSLKNRFIKWCHWTTAKRWLIQHVDNCQYAIFSTAAFSQQAARCKQRKMSKVSTKVVVHTASDLTDDSNRWSLFAWFRGRQAPLGFAHRIVRGMGLCVHRNR